MWLFDSNVGLATLGIALGMGVYMTHDDPKPKLDIPPPAVHSATDAKVVQAFNKMESHGYRCTMRPVPARVIFAFDSGQVAVISFSKAWKASHAGGGEVLAYCSK